MTPVDAALLATVSALVALLLVSHRRENVAALVNAVVALGATGVPAALERLLSTAGAAPVAFDPLLTLWVAVAGVLHVLGMLGRYESTWWWDHLTHTVSATLVAALCYAALLVTTGGTGTLAVAAATVGATLALGAAWEALELAARAVGERYDVEPVLVHYGWDDTAYDLLFDGVGAVLVVALDVRLFVPVAETLLGAL